MTATARMQMVAMLPRLRRFALGLTGSRDEADELVQAACERGLARLHQWQPGTRLDSWMYRIIQSMWIDEWRRRRARVEQVDTEMLESLSGSDGRHEAEVRLTLDEALQAMARLPDEQRVVLMLVSVEGLSYRETAEVLDVEMGTVMSRLSRARQKLRAMMNEGATPMAGNKSVKVTSERDD